MWRLHNLYQHCLSVIYYLFVIHNRFAQKSSQSNRLFFEVWVFDAFQKMSNQLRLQVLSFEHFFQINAAFSFGLFIGQNIQQLLEQLLLFVLFLWFFIHLILFLVLPQCLSYQFAIVFVDKCRAYNSSQTKHNCISFLYDPLLFELHFLVILVIHDILVSNTL